MTKVLNVELKLTKEEKEKIVNECIDILNDRLVEEFEKIKEEIENIRDVEVTDGCVYVSSDDVNEILDNHISELKGENNNA